jgi:hypothetical protein
VKGGGNFFYLCPLVCIRGNKSFDFVFAKLFWIDFFGLEDFFGDGFPLAGGGIISSIEAAAIALVAGGDILLDADQDDIHVAVGQDFLDVLKVFAAFAFEGEAAAAAAKGVDFAGLQRLFQGSAVHVGLHENLAVGDVLDDQRDQAVGVEFKLV